MKTQKSIKITAPKGQVINMDEFNTSGEIKFVDEIPPVLLFPTEWQIFNDRGYYINKRSVIESVVIDKIAASYPDNRNVLPNRDLAEQIVIFEQLITLKEEYRRIELHNNSSLTPIDWNDCTKPKYCVQLRSNNELSIGVLNTISNLFSFQTRTAAELFKDNFQNMILKCKDLLG